MNERPRREKSRVGLREVASIAGVSTATVSRVINRPESVSEDLRTRVTMVIDQLGWVPNAAARALSSQRTGAIGAIFPALALGDFARAIDAMQDALAERNSLLLLARSKYDSGLEYSLVRKLAERGVDGLVLVGSTREPAYEDFLAKLEIPYVNSFVFEQDSSVPCVGPGQPGRDGGDGRLSRRPWSSKVRPDRADDAKQRPCSCPARGRAGRLWPVIASPSLHRPCFRGNGASRKADGCFARSSRRISDQRP
jgi:hypothetical protein